MSVVVCCRWQSFLFSIVNLLGLIEVDDQKVKIDMGNHLNELCNIFAIDEDDGKHLPSSSEILLFGCGNIPEN